MSSYPTNRKLSACTTYFALSVILASLPVALLKATPPSPMPPAPAVAALTNTKFCENARGCEVSGASGSKLPRFRFAPCVEDVADLGAVDVDGFSADEDSGVWCETVPDTVSSIEGGVNDADVKLCAYQTQKETLVTYGSAPI